MVFLSLKRNTLRAWYFSMTQLLLQVDGNPHEMRAPLGWLENCFHLILQYWKYKYTWHIEIHRVEYDNSNLIRTYNKLSVQKSNTKNRDKMVKKIFARWTLKTGLSWASQQNSKLNAFLLRRELQRVTTKNEDSSWILLTYEADL